MEVAIYSCNTSNLDNCTDGKLLELEYGHYVALFFKGPRKLQVLVDRLNDTVDVFGMCSVPSKGKMLLWEWLGLKPNLFLT